VRLAPRRRTVATMARPMPIGKGQALDFDYLARKAHNPGRRKKQRAFYKDARIIRDFRKLSRTDADVAAAGSSRDFTKPSKRRRAEAAEADAGADAAADGADGADGAGGGGDAADAAGAARARKPKRRKADPFKKIVDARRAAADEAAREREAAEAERRDALRARKARAKLAKKGRGGRMKAQLGSILSKLEADRGAA